jgi:DNA mismatch endonuclease, patch repair protein
MQANRGRDTTPELLLRRLLREAGYPGYRLHWRTSSGRPDIAYPGRGIAIFVNGCFWHRCPICNPPTPKSNRDFWLAKFAENTERDARQAAELESMGWTVITVWECRLDQCPKAEIARVIDALAAPNRPGVNDGRKLTPL